MELLHEEKTRPSSTLGVVDRYRLRAGIASGGMATVYLAEMVKATGSTEVQFRKDLAVKLIHAANRYDDDTQNSFYDEARISGRIEHPNVCRVVDCGMVDGAPFLVMEYLHGETLSKVIGHGMRESTGGVVPAWLAAFVVEGAARGIHAAHETKDEKGRPLGIVHRDVSPQNIFVTYDGAAKVVDFGIALAQGRVTETKEAKFKGKIAYASPEMLLPDLGPVDRQSDVYSLGVVLWEMLAGQRLFSQGKTTELEYFARVLGKVSEGDIPDIKEVRSDVPEQLAEVVRMAMHSDRAERYPTAEAMAGDLEDYCNRLPESPSGGKVMRWMNRAFAERKEMKERLLAGTLKEAEAAALGVHMSPTAEAATLHGGSRTGSVSREALQPIQDDVPTRIGRSSEGVHEASAMQSGEAAAVAAAAAKATVGESLSSFNETSRLASLPTKSPLGPLAWVVGVVLLIAGGAGIWMSQTAKTSGEVLGVAAPPPAALEPKPAVGVDALPVGEPVEALAGEAEAVDEEVADAEAAPGATPDPSVVRRAERRGSAVRAVGRPAPEPAAAPAPAAEGTLRVFMTGRGWLYLDGRRIDEVPGAVELPAGRQAIEVRGVNGRSTRQTVTVPGNVRLELE